MVLVGRSRKKNITRTYNFVAAARFVCSRVVQGFRSPGELVLITLHHHNLVTRGVNPCYSPSHSPVVFHLHFFFLKSFSSCRVSLLCGPFVYICTQKHPTMLQCSFIYLSVAARWYASVQTHEWMPDGRESERSVPREQPRWFRKFTLILISF